MFKQVIRSTQLTSDAANSFFQHIGGESFQRDVSFISTLRALVAPRMKEDESIYLSFPSSNLSADKIREFSSKQNAIRYVLDTDYIGKGNIVIHNFNHHSPDSNLAWMELMKSNLEGVYPGWHRMEKVTDFFKKSFYSLCFINPEMQSVVVFVDNMDIRKMHYLQCSIFAFLPWYFDPKQGVSKIEMELIESLRGKDASKYDDCIAAIAEQYDFRTAKIRQLLSGFETRYERVELDRVRQEVLHFDSCIADLNAQIGRYLKERRDTEIKVLGLEAKIANGSDESEIMDYFLRNNRLVLESVDNMNILFTVKAYIEYFDEDLAKRVIQNDSSYVYRPNGRGCNNIIDKADMRKLLTAVFLDQTIRIRACAAYRFSMDGNVRGISRHLYGSECREYTPNPHIDGFSCIGNYSQSINELLRRHDYIGAIEQCAASCKSLNFNDSTVMCEFMRRIYGIADRQNEINTRCFELPDGSVVTASDAIKWLKSQEVQTDE